MQNLVFNPDQISGDTSLLHPGGVTKLALQIHWVVRIKSLDDYIKHVTS